MLGRSLGIWARNIIPFTIVSGAGFLPILGAAALLPEPRVTCKNVSDILIPPAIAAGVVLLWVAMPAAVIHGVLHELRGERASARGCARASSSSSFSPEAPAGREWGG